MTSRMARAGWDGADEAADFDVARDCLSTNGEAPSLRRHRLFAGLSDEQILRLERGTRIRRCGKGKSFFSQRDTERTVHLVDSGRIRLCNFTRDGKQMTMSFVDAGDLVGELVLFDGREPAGQAEAAVDSALVRLSKSALRRAIDEAPHFAMELARRIGRRCQRVERRLQSTIFRSVPERLVELLLELAERYGRATGDGVRLEIRLSHQELASLIGTARESVTHSLGELQSRGLLRISRSRILIRQLRALADLVDDREPRLPEFERSCTLGSEGNRDHMDCTGGSLDAAHSEGVTILRDSSRTA